MSNFLPHLRAIFIATGSLSFLAGCSGVDALTNHAELDVHTHMSETVFLDPVPASAKTVYVGVRNTSDYPTLDFRTPLNQAIEARGYTIVNEPGTAHYMLQVNVLQAGKLDDQQAAALLSANYGQPLFSGAVAGALTGYGSGSSAAGLGVGLGVAAATWAFNQAYQNVTYAVTTDIQISERPFGGGTVHQHTHNYHGRNNHTSSTTVTALTPEGAASADAESLNTSERSQDIDEENRFKQYQVRDVAYADKVNLRMDEAVPTLVQHLTSSLANLFE
jgi:hypothetical protein